MTNESSANAIIGNTLRIIASGEYHPGAELTQKMASYIIELEQKLTDMAVQLANAESKCRGLAAENAGLNVFIEEECFVYSSDTPEPIDANDCKPETKVTDAFLAEVRAQGVEMMAAEADQLMNEFGDDSYKVMVTADLQRFANAFAAQLRKGAEL
ncbi:TPA: hypothetical protein ACGR9Y_000915 [Citrobacter freundii]